MSSQLRHRNGICGPDCRYRSLYEGSQTSLTDMAHRQAEALSRVGRLRSGVVMSLRRNFARAFLEAESALGHRLSDVDDEVLLAYLGAMMAAAPVAAAAPPSGLEDLRAALEAAGLPLPAGTDLGSWAEAVRAQGTVIDTNEVDLSDIFGLDDEPVPPPSLPTQRRTLQSLNRDTAALNTTLPSTRDDLAAIFDEPHVPAVMPVPTPSEDSQEDSTEVPRNSRSRRRRKARAERGSAATAKDDSVATDDPEVPTARPGQDGVEQVTRSTPPAPAAPAPAADPVDPPAEDLPFPEDSPAALDEPAEDPFENLPFPEEDPFPEDPFPSGADVSLPEPSTPEVSLPEIVPPESPVEPAPDQDGAALDELFAEPAPAVAAGPAPTGGRRSEKAPTSRRKSLREAGRRAPEPEPEPEPVLTTAPQSRPAPWATATQPVVPTLADPWTAPAPAPKATPEPEAPAEQRVMAPAPLRPELFPTVPKTTRTRRGANKTVRTQAASPDSSLFDVPTDAGSSVADSPLTDEVRNALMAAVCIPRPVFTSDLVAVAGSRELVDAWEMECRAGSSAVRFVAAKTRHRARGSLVLPADFLREAASEFRRSTWAECMERYRGTQLYEIAVLLHRIGEDVISCHIGDQTLSLRLASRGRLSGVVVVLGNKLSSGDLTRQALAADLEGLLGERLSLVAVLTPRAESFDLMAAAVVEEAQSRKWAPAMPVVAARTWEYADDQGSSSQLLLGA